MPDFELVWNPYCICIDWCDADEDPDAPDDPAPDPEDTTDIPLDPEPDDGEAEYREDGG